MKTALEENPGLDGVFVTNYEMTIGSIIALNEEGRKIGKDVEFMGFDRVEITRAFVSDMQTVNQPLAEIGKVAADTLVDMISGGAPRDVVLEAEIL